MCSKVCGNSTQNSNVCDFVRDNCIVECFSETSESGTQCDMFTFSPRLCEKLLPDLSDDQINTEFKYLQLINKMD